MHHKNQWNDLFAIEKDIAYETHMQNTIDLVQSKSNRLNIPAKPVLSLTGLAAKQLKFLAWKIWVFQGMILAVLCAVFFCIYTSNINLWFLSILPKFLCCCGGIIVMSSIPILKRASQYKMLELEQSTHFSIVGSLLSQLLFIGCGDLGMLAVLALIAGRCGLTISVTIVSLIVPFLTASAACLMIWVRTSPSFFQTAGALFCILSSLFVNALISKIGSLFMEKQFFFWAAYCLICIGVLYHEYRRLYHYNSVEKMLPGI